MSPPFPTQLGFSLVYSSIYSPAPVSPLTDIINFFFFKSPFPLSLPSIIKLLQDEALLPLPVSVDRWRLVQDRRCLRRAIGKEAPKKIQKKFRFFFLFFSFFSKTLLFFSWWYSCNDLQILILISCLCREKGGLKENAKRRANV